MIPYEGHSQPELFTKQSKLLTNPTFWDTDDGTGMGFPHDINQAGRFQSFQRPMKGPSIDTQPPSASLGTNEPAKLVVTTLPPDAHGHLEIDGV